jgi:hypothetical protein
VHRDGPHTDLKQPRCCGGGGDGCEAVDPTQKSFDVIEAFSDAVLDHL